MYLVRYPLTFICEFFYSWRNRKNIQSWGHKKGSFRALLSWCHGSSVYCAENKHPLKYCINRAAWERWMLEG